MIMEKNNFDGRTASYKVTSLSAMFGSESTDRYFSNLEDAKSYLESNRKMAEFRFGSDYYLYQKTGHTWTLIDRLGNHFV